MGNLEKLSHFHKLLLDMETETQVNGIIAQIGRENFEAVMKLAILISERKAKRSYLMCKLLSGICNYFHTSIRNIGSLALHTYATLYQQSIIGVHSNVPRFSFYNAVFDGKLYQVDPNIVPVEFKKLWHNKKASIIKETVMNGFPEGSIGDLIRNDDVNELSSLIHETSEFDFNMKIYCRDSICYSEYLPPGSNVCELGLLSLAAFYGSEECFSFLLASGASVTLQTYICSIIGDNVNIYNTIKESNMIPMKLRKEISIYAHACNIYKEFVYEALENTVQLCYTNLNYIALTMTMQCNYQQTNNTSDWSILYDVIENQSLDVAEFMFDKLVNVNSTSKGESIDEENYIIERNALHYAADKNDIELAKLLLKKGINPNGWYRGEFSRKFIDGIGMIVGNWYEEKTAVHIAVSKGSLEMLRLLQSSGADLNAIYKIFEKDGSRKYEKTALHIAIERMSVEIVKFLIDNGASVNLKYRVNDNEKSTLDMALESKSDVIIQYLNNRGTQSKTTAGNAVNLVKNIHPRDALQSACESGSVETVSSLIKRGINKNNIYDVNGVKKTALHIAIETNNVRLVEYLVIDACVDLEIPYEDNSGQRSALHLAVEKGNVEIVTILVKNGADVNSKSDFGHTPLKKSEYFRYEKKDSYKIFAPISELLKANGAR